MNERTTKLYRIPAVAFLVFLVACGGNPAPTTQPPSIEGQLALYGRKVVQTANLALDTVDTITQARLANLPVQVATGVLAQDQVPAAEAKIKAEARKAILTIRDVGSQAQALAVTLQIIETASTGVDQAKGIEAARQILTNMQQLVVQGSVPIGDETSRQVLAALMGQLSDLLMNVALLLPPPAGPAVPAK